MIAVLAMCGSAYGATLGDVYVERDDCSNEILFGSWPVKKQTIVYSEPSTESRRLGTLEPNANVIALECEAHITPGVAQIVGQPYKTTKDLNPKEVVYILDSFEGGRTRVFQNGVFYITKIATKIGQCDDRDDPYRCWARVLKEPGGHTWIKIEMTGGSSFGWVRLGDGNILPTPRNTH